jgi:hypothetical protein
MSSLLSSPVIKLGSEERLVWTKVSHLRISIVTATLLNLFFRDKCAYLQKENMIVCQNPYYN